MKTVLMLVVAIAITFTAISFIPKANAEMGGARIELCQMGAIKCGFDKKENVDVKETTQ